MMIDFVGRIGHVSISLLKTFAAPNSHLKIITHLTYGKMGYIFDNSKKMQLLTFSFILRNLFPPKKLIPSKISQISYRRKRSGIYQLLQPK